MASQPSTHCSAGSTPTYAKCRPHRWTSCVRIDGGRALCDLRSSAGPCLDACHDDRLLDGRSGGDGGDIDTAALAAYAEEALQRHDGGEVGAGASHHLQHAVLEERCGGGGGERCLQAHRRSGDVGDSRRGALQRKSRRVRVGRCNARLCACVHTAIEMPRAACSRLTATSAVTTDVPLISCGGGALRNRPLLPAEKLLTTSRCSTKEAAVLELAVTVKGTPAARGRVELCTLPAMKPGALPPLGKPGMGRASCTSSEMPPPARSAARRATVR